MEVGLALEAIVARVREPRLLREASYQEDLIVLLFGYLEMS